MSKYLVRTTRGANSFEKLKERNKYMRRLVNLPEGTSEILLWRQVRHTGAKAVHIFKNTNDNNMRSATVFFSNRKDLLDSSKFAISYYDNKLSWSIKTSISDEEAQRTQERTKEVSPKRSIKSLEKMKETEQDLGEECSKSAQKKNQNNRNILEERTGYLAGKRVVNKWKLRELTIIETSEDDEELMTLEESRQKTTQGVNRKTREKLYLNESSKYKKM